MMPVDIEGRAAWARGEDVRRPDFEATARCGRCGEGVIADRFGDWRDAFDSYFCGISLIPHGPTPVGKPT